MPGAQAAMVVCIAWLRGNTPLADNAQHHGDCMRSTTQIPLFGLVKLQRNA
jgi:hypothetical protein